MHIHTIHDDTYMRSVRVRIGVFLCNLSLCMPTHEKEEESRARYAYFDVLAVDGNTGHERE